MADDTVYNLKRSQSLRGDQLKEINQEPIYMLKAETHILHLHRNTRIDILDIVFLWQYNGLVSNVISFAKHVLAISKMMVIRHTTTPESSQFTPISSLACAGDERNNGTSYIKSNGHNA